MIVQTNLWSGSGQTNLWSGSGQTNLWSGSGQTNLWSGSGQKETSVQEAGTACDNAAETPVSALNRDGYEMQLVFMEKLVKEVEA